ncbi:hypothetical protein ANCCEY_11794 [Ancylostoma ceylanicum]|uniref:Uncharacterized protein n=1 Tax=Ancylostoma ceylanicum TaxID=53326 RepID=A0A0D6LNA7_9BILA|nr:hypothetical protein ANCCEY_11794 [Ancylostoma ceylanicum]
MLPYGVGGSLYRPAPHKIPTFKSADLESAIESNTWTLFEDPTEDYDHLVRGLLKCADASRLSQPTTTPRLNAHATALLEKRKAVKLDPNATHLEKVITGKACRVAVKESLRDYGRMKLLEAAETKSSIKRCKRDLNDQRNVMAALKDKEGKMQSSRRAMENIVQQFYTELFRSSTLVPRCPLPPPEDLLPILESEILLNRMGRILDDYQPVEQAGFRKNFSCMDNIQAVTQLIERSREYHFPLVLVFVDV